MIKEAINRVLELAPPVLTKLSMDDDEGQRIYVNRDLRSIKDPTPTKVDLHTLGGLIDWIGCEGQHVDMTKIILHVVDATTVRAIGQLQEKWEQRAHYLTASPLLRQPFPMDGWLEIEDFIIKMQCGFAESENKKKVLKCVSSVKGNHVVTSEDDGVSQKVAMESEARRLEEVTLDPMVALQPYRTFSEVEQPESLFLLRLQPRQEGLPRVALFEADGGSWKNTAIINISDFLRDNEVVKTAGVRVLA